MRHRDGSCLLGSSACSEILCSSQDGSKYISWFDNPADTRGLPGHWAFDTSLKAALEAKEEAC